jgi:predicted tellurium resistance membrane protein TerC
LLVPDAHDNDEVQAAGNLWRAVWTVAVADAVMSLDNVIAIAAAADGSLLLLVIGLALSIPLILAGAVLVMTVLERFPPLLWAGAALLGWVAGEVIATDPALSGHLVAVFGDKLAKDVHLAAAGAGAVLVIAVGGLWRRMRAAKIAAAR